jgi:hypothetical protein
VLLIARYFLRQFAAEDGKKFTSFSPAVEAAPPSLAGREGLSRSAHIRNLQTAMRSRLRAICKSQRIASVSILSTH